MQLFRLQVEAGSYLSVEVVGETREVVIRQFASWAVAHCKRSGGTWAADEIARVINNQSSMIELITPGIEVDGELTFVDVKDGDIAKALKGTGLEYLEQMIPTAPEVDPEMAEAALLQAGLNPADYGFRSIDELMAEDAAAG